MSPAASTVTRRTMIAAPLALTVGAAASAPDIQAPARSPELIPLWPGDPPGGRDGPPLIETYSGDRFLTGIARPAMLVYRPAPGTATGAAALVAPGGGYAFVSTQNEGVEQAGWLNALGVTVFVLLYRLPGEGWRNRRDAPLQDAQRAVRLVRANARAFGIDPARVLALGFSAGGHLMGSLATRHAETTYAPIDAADREPARPDAAALVYPVITFGPYHSHGGSRDTLLGPRADPALPERYSIETRVGPATPPVFLMQANDDDTVPAENSVIMWQAMRAAARPCELHLFPKGGHGFGVRLPRDYPASAWPELLTRFARAQGVFPA